MNYTLTRWDEKTRRFANPVKQYPMWPWMVALFGAIALAAFGFYWLFTK